MKNSEKFISAFAEALGIEKEKVITDLKYQEIPEWDSMAHMVLVNELEMTFDISLDTDEVIDMSSVEKAKEIINNHGIKF